MVVRKDRVTLEEAWLVHESPWIGWKEGELPKNQSQRHLIRMTEQYVNKRDPNETRYP